MLSVEFLPEADWQKTRIGCEIVNNKYPGVVMMMIDTDDKDERRSAVRGGIRK